jgi:hypothetical protein
VSRIGGRCFVDTLMFDKGSLLRWDFAFVPASRGLFFRLSFAD